MALRTATAAMPLRRCSLWSSSPRPMAHKSIALTTELKELAVTHGMPQPAAIFCPRPPSFARFVQQSMCERHRCDRVCANGIGAIAGLKMEAKSRMLKEVEGSRQPWTLWLKRQRAQAKSPTLCRKRSRLNAVSEIQVRRHNRSFLA